MKAIYCLGIFLIVLVFSCTPSANTDQPFDINDPNIIWAKRSNFKVDFEDSEGDVKNVKVLDKKLAEIILEEVEAGSIPVYDHYEGTELSKAEVQNLFHKVDTILVINPDTDEEELKVIRNDLDIPSVKRFRIEQDWYYNKASKKLVSKTVSFSPLLEKYGPDGAYRGDLPLFKVKLD